MHRAHRLLSESTLILCTLRNRPGGRRTPDYFTGIAKYYRADRVPDQNSDLESDPENREQVAIRFANLSVTKQGHIEQDEKRFLNGSPHCPAWRAKNTLASKRSRSICILPITPRDAEFASAIPFMLVPRESRLLIIALAVLFDAIAGCGGPSHDIVGKWRMSGDANAIVWEFSNNGSVLIENTRGRYILDRNRVKIETPFAKTVYQMEFSADRMILREPNGPKLEFTRVR